MLCSKYHPASPVACGIIASHETYVHCMSYISVGQHAGKEPPGKALLYMCMQVMHEAGLAHCDIKPANILMTSDGSAKIADFGAACAINSHTGQLAAETTKNGGCSIMRDREIQRLMKHHMNHVARTTRDSISAFGSVWSGHAEQRRSFRELSPNETQEEAECTSHRETSDRHSDVQCPAWTGMPEEPLSLLTQTEQQQPPACEAPFEGKGIEEHLKGKGIEEHPDYIRHRASQSMLLRSFRSCPGGSSLASPETSTPDVKVDRTVRWHSGTGGSGVGPEQLQRCSTTGDKMFATRFASINSSNGYSAWFKAYSLRDVPMVCLLYSSLSSCMYVLIQGSSASRQLSRGHNPPVAVGGELPVRALGRVSTFGLPSSQPRKKDGEILLGIAPPQHCTVLLNSDLQVVIVLTRVSFRVVSVRPHPQCCELTCVFFIFRMLQSIVSPFGLQIVSQSPQIWSNELLKKWRHVVDSVPKDE